VVDRRGLVVRQMRAEDVGAMVLLGEAMHGESAFSERVFSPEKLGALLHHYVANPEHCFGSVAYIGPDMVGMFVGYTTDYFFGPERLACDLFWYVSPEHRGSRAGVRLLRSFELWAKSRGVVEVSAGVSTAVAFERTGALLQKLGYTQVGGNYKRVVVE
jgi:GNAT superfamily N-acetyltransferase